MQESGWITRGEVRNEFLRWSRGAISAYVGISRGRAHTTGCGPPSTSPTWRANEVLWSAIAPYLPTPPLTLALLNLWMLRGVGRAAKEWYVGRQRDISSLPPPRDFGPSIEATYRGEYTIYIYIYTVALVLPFPPPQTRFLRKRSVRKHAIGVSISRPPF